MRERYPPVRNSAFTLIELLTVIGILSVLAAILIPVVSKVRTKAQTAECLSNMRQVGALILLYTQANNEKLPGPLRGGQDTRYPYAENDTEQLVHYLGEMTELNLTGDTPTRAKLMVCTSFVSVIDSPIARCYEVRTDWIEMQNGTRKLPFGYPSASPGAPANQPQMLQNIKNISSEWMMQDLDALGTPSYSGNALAPKQPVHGNVRNYLFFDGHVESLPTLEDTEI